MKKFTREQLMLYLFNEASPILSFAINKALHEDYELKKEIEMLKRSKKQLEKLKEIRESPGPKTINAILEYAKSASKKKRDNG
jgi:hypothetical protein